MIALTKGQTRIIACPQCGETPHRLEGIQKWPERMEREDEAVWTCLQCGSTRMVKPIAAGRE